MLRANVGLSRKLSENFNSTGFSLNLEGEIDASLSDPEAVVGRIRELYSVAELALERQISESHSNDAVASRDDDNHSDPTPSRTNGHHAHEAAPPSQPRNGNPSNGEPATNKQVQYLLTLAKRQKLYGANLDARIEQIIGRRCSPYDLTKKEAGAVIDDLNPEGAENNRSRR
jgi:hypothetical protein